MNEDLNVSRLKALRKVSVHLSNSSPEAAAKLNQLYKAGRVFAPESCEVRRDADVYVAACALADTLGKDIASHIGSVASGQTKYTIIYNMRVLLYTHVGPGRCAVGMYDFDAGICSYEGIVSC